METKYFIDWLTHSFIHWQWYWVMWTISKYCLWPENITLYWCYVNLPPFVSNFNEYNTEYTNHKSQVISRKSKFPSRASISSVRSCSLKYMLFVCDQCIEVLFSLYTTQLYTATVHVNVIHVLLSNLMYWKFIWSRRSQCSVAVPVCDNGRSVSKIKFIWK